MCEYENADCITLHPVWWRGIRNMLREAEAAGNYSMIQLVLCLHKQWDELDIAHRHILYLFFWDKSGLIVPLQRTCKSIKDFTAYTQKIFFFYLPLFWLKKKSCRQATDCINLNNCGELRGIVFLRRFTLTGWQLQLDS